jgi:hypothetical protein
MSEQPSLLPSLAPDLILDQPPEDLVATQSIQPTNPRKKESRKIQRSRKSKKARYQPIYEEAKKKLDSIQETTKCIICYEHMYRPTTLPCGHTGCTACFLNIITYLPIGTPLTVTRKCPLCRTPHLPGFNFTVNEKLREVITHLHGEQAYISRGIQQMDEQLSFIHIKPHDSLSLPSNTTRFLKIVAYLLGKYICAFYTTEEVVKGWNLIVQYFNIYLPSWSIFTTDNILFHGPRQLQLNMLEDPRALKSMIVSFPESNLVYPDIPDHKLLEIFWNSFHLQKHVAKVMYV